MIRCVLDVCVKFAGFKVEQLSNNVSTTNAPWILEHPIRILQVFHLKLKMWFFFLHHIYFIKDGAKWYQKMKSGNFSSKTPIHDLEEKRINSFFTWRITKHYQHKMSVCQHENQSTTVKMLVNNKTEWKENFSKKLEFFQQKWLSAKSHYFFLGVKLQTDEVLVDISTYTQ